MKIASNNIIYNKNKIKCKNFCLFLLWIALTFFPFENEEKQFQYHQDNITIVSAYYKSKSKHKPRDYLDWINNFVLLNKSIVFFTNKKFKPHLKRLRPKKYHDKTIFFEIELEDFYSYSNFYNEYRKAHEIDFEKRYQTITLYMIWAEKCSFLKKVIINNYFNSTCFYWIDIGYFREKKEMEDYINNWPSTKMCYDDARVLLGQVKNFSDIEKTNIINFDIETHIRLQKNINVIGGIFGGQCLNLLKFINLYYNSIRLFLKNNLFIGKDQNIFTYIAFSHPEVVKLIFCKSYNEYRKYIA